MRSLNRLVVGLTLALACGAAWAAPCAGFADVDDTRSFCPNVEWLKNRAITLGCTSTTQFCPDDSVTRLSMAAFMNRLGTALTPVAVKLEATPGALDVDLGPVVCATDAFAVTGYPRRAYVDVGVSGTAAAALDVGVIVAMSVDNGATWVPVGAESRGAVLANQWGNVSNIAYADLDVGQSVRFGAMVVRADAGSADLSDSRCNVQAVVYSRNGTSSPF
jgi:hypothetical protein